jgi:hydroxymethylpyrimidine/phosphomethylpyrimidine kinase
MRSGNFSPPIFYFGIVRVEIRVFFSSNKKNLLMMKNVHMVISVAGSDSSGGAGVQADLKTMSALGVFGTTCITAITCQNTMGVYDILPLPQSIIRGQIDAVLKDLPIKAMKIGMLYSDDVVEAVAESIVSNNFKGEIILDPVMIATSGNSLSSHSLKDAMIKHLFPIASLVTPNLHEAEMLSGAGQIKNEDDMRRVAEIIVGLGAKAVLIKGGHLQGRKLKNVLLQNQNGEMIFSEIVSEKVDSKNTHGTGCTLSSAIASYCSIGCSIKEAVEKATIFVHDAVENAKDVFLGQGHGALNHFYNPQKLIIDESICE